LPVQACHPRLPMELPLPKSELLPCSLTDQLENFDI
jgi:hypothetical protein